MRVRQPDIASDDENIIRQACYWGNLFILDLGESILEKQTQPKVYLWSCFNLKLTASSKTTFTIQIIS